MPINRFFIDLFPFTAGHEVTLEGDEAHHLRVVTRTRIGENIELVNGQNELAEAVVVEVAKHTVTLRIEKCVKKKQEKREVILVQAFTRQQDLIVEKATELGATQIWLFPGKRSEKQELSQAGYMRLKRIMIGAMKQCGRWDLPKLELKPELRKWVKADIVHAAFFGDTTPEAQTFQRQKESLLFFIGPESGFSESEEQLLRLWGVQGVRLHHNILRAETAAIIAIAQAGL